MKVRKASNNLSFLSREAYKKKNTKMHNGGGYLNQSPWSNSFYHQYLQQHAQLTQWFQQIHQNGGALHQSAHSCSRHCCTMQHHSAHNCSRHSCARKRHCCTTQHHSAYNCPRPCCASSHHSAHNCCATRAPPVPIVHAHHPTPYYPAVNSTGEGYSQAPHAPIGLGNPRAPHAPIRVGHLQAPHAPVGHAHGKERAVVDEDSSEEEDDSDDGEDSEDELVFNVDAILALRDAKDVSDHDSVDSFELLDSVSDDMKEYVKMDAYGNLERRTGKLGEVNAREEELNRQGQLRELYGDGAVAIGGMEALMAVQFDYLCDTLQPTLWPVLPILL